MREIYATENPDGTFEVRIKSTSVSVSDDGRGKIRKTMESEATILSAKLEITAVQSASKDGTLMTFETSE